MLCLYRLLGAPFRCLASGPTLSPVGGTPPPVLLHVRCNRVDPTEPYRTHTGQPRPPGSIGAACHRHEKELNMCGGMCPTDPPTNPPNTNRRPDKCAGPAQPVRDATNVGRPQMAEEDNPSIRANYTHRHISHNRLSQDQRKVTRRIVTNV